jgi:hypothetical protein
LDIWNKALKLSKSVMGRLCASMQKRMKEIMPLVTRQIKRSGPNLGPNFTMGFVASPPMSVYLLAIFDPRVSSLLRNNWKSRFHLLQLVTLIMYWARRVSPWFIGLLLLKSNVLARISLWLWLPTSW